MSSSEAHWLGLYNQLREVLGEEHADTFVNKLEELATRDQIARLEAELAEFKKEVREGFDKVNLRFDALFLQIAAEGRRQSTVLATSMIALTAIFTLILTLMR